MRKTYRLLESLSQGRRKRGKKIKCVREKNLHIGTRVHMATRVNQRASALISLFFFNQKNKKNAVAHDCISQGTDAYLLMSNTGVISLDLGKFFLLIKHHVINFIIPKQWIKSKEMLTFMNLL